MQGAKQEDENDAILIRLVQKTLNKRTRPIENETKRPIPQGQNIELY